MLALLRFTVFWAFIKKRKWSFFASAASNLVLTEKEWISLAESVAVEEAVPLRRIRCLDDKLAEEMEFPDASDFFLRRKLHVGDLVMGLHMDGTRWLPAVVEAIGGCHQVVDLRYPLSQRELDRSKTVSASRQLLHLPSSVSALLRYPQPFRDEIQSSAFAFDLVDSDRLGM